ncbi:hypothetical protein NLG97_g1398 [Lecanicillium saksenae]|uniref:Uncharacterized protein n=1 Tax=Lecanicillium saksenae TaxID=468837 RepID=A0ACC1R3V2_9HYPO|nr:hypothetical protein NLG97_g1398 [Lecanicillium saksenae]
MPQRVLIVGGGLAGLALAQGLKKATPSIPFRIFERDSSAAFRAQGYRIRISGAALKTLLPASVFEAFEATSNNLIQPGHAIDALTGKPNPEAFMPGPPPGAAPNAMKPYNVDRAVLRNVLLQGLENDVSYEKKFKAYEVLEDNTVQVSFADGTVERGTLLVGADGVRSGIRKQLLPDFPLLDTEGRSVFGKTDLTEEIIAKLPKEYLNGMCLASVPGPAAENPTKLLFEVMRFDPAARSLGLGVPADYIYWVLCSREDVTDTKVAGISKLLSLSSSESAELAKGLMQDWDESVRAITNSPNDGSTATLAFFACTKDGLPASWSRLRDEHADMPVTLIGDAAHPMPPVGGVGANSAFQDSLDLFQELISQSNDKALQAAALAKYEKLMVERVGDAVEKSSSGAVRFFGMKPQSELKAVTL